MMAWFLASCWQRFLAIALTGPFPQTPGPTPAPGLGEVCLNGELGTCLRLALGQGWWLFLVALVGAAVWKFFGAAIKGWLKPVEEQAEKQTQEIYARDAHDQATMDYLEHLYAAFQYFKYRGKPAEETATPTLDDAYLPLRVSYEREREAQKVASALEGRMASPAVSLAEALGQTRRLAVIGAAGSGKSTLLQWAALACAKARLGKGKISAGEQALVAALGKDTPLPVLVPLRAFDEYCKKKTCNRSAAALRSFITARYQDKLPGKIPNDFFTRHKNCLWMLDGLDEVDTGDRPSVRQAVEDFLNQQENRASVVLIASRPSAAETAAQMPGFTPCYVQRLSSDERDRLVRDWYGAILPRDAQKAKKMADDLCLRLARSPQKVRELATTPLMVTIFGVVYYRLHDLPRLRAHLYEEAVEILVMDTQHHESDEAPGIDTLAGMTWQTRRNRIAWIAFEMFCRKEESIGEGDLVERIRARFSGKEEARAFLQTIAARGGLLECEDDRYGFFTHRTFQEFLAGRYLVEEYPEDRSAFLTAHLEDDQWEEPIRLAVGYLAISGEKNANELIQQLSRLGEEDAARARALALAGFAMSDLQEEVLFDETRQKVIPPALALFTANPPRVPAAERRRLGLALGAAGDPRFQPGPAPLRPQIQLILPELTPPIPAGLYRLGTSADDARQIEAQGARTWPNEQPDHLARLSAFQIARFPVANAEYDCFWRSGGYGSPGGPRPEWWSEAGWRWRAGDWRPDVSIYSKEYQTTIRKWLEQRPVERRSAPFFWDNPDWNGRSQPVVGVCWFEAEAYCGWLRAVTGQPYGLPTEAQWEAAARAVILPGQPGERAPENRLWPWGNEWDPGKSNTGDDDSGLGGTTPMGMYPHGASPCGAEDMAGNAWEWCRDTYDSTIYQQRNRLETPLLDPLNLTSAPSRVARGGSWNYDRDGARCAYRSRDIPVNFIFNLGFRVVLSPTSS